MQLLRFCRRVSPLQGSFSGQPNPAWAPPVAACCRAGAAGAAGRAPLCALRENLGALLGFLQGWRGHGADAELYWVWFCTGGASASSFIFAPREHPRFSLTFAHPQLLFLFHHGVLRV